MSKQLNCVTGKGLTVRVKVTTNFKRCRKEKSENLMVKTPCGTRKSLGYEKAILCISKRRVNVKLQHILKTD